MSRPLEPVRREAIRAHAIAALLDLPEAIGRYAIRGELGRGGMGVVYHAYDPQLERDVAVKVINPALLGANEPEARLEERFEREMRAASPIFHPNVVTILDAGIATIAGERSAYYVMEHVTGESLEDRIRNAGPLPRTEAIRVALAVSHGLAALHERGLVHRDVKPSNVLLPIGQAPMISDFGLIHLVDEASLSSDGSLIEGSPHGLAPEQIGGGPVDERSDLFALGALLVRLWTGHEPFAAASLEKRLTRIQSDEPDGVDQLPSDVARIARSLLEKAPEDRPPNAQDVIHQLTALQSQSRSSLLLRTARFLAVAGMLAGLGLGWGAWQHRRLEARIENERANQSAEIELQLERAATLARPLLTANSLTSLPADERRALADRIEGIANRVAWLRTQHREERERLRQERRVWPDWLAAKLDAEASPPSLALSLPSSGVSSSKARIQDPEHHFDADASQRILKQIDLLDREFNLDTQIVVVTGGSQELDATETNRARRIRFVLDFEQESGSIQVSRALEPLLSDALLGALLREQLLPLLHRGEAEFGLRLTFRILSASLREALTSKSTGRLMVSENDGVDSVINGQFAGAGAATQRVPHAEGLSGAIIEQQRPGLSAGPTPEITWDRFVAWIGLESADVELTIFTPASRELLRRWPMSRPYWRSLLQQAKETPLETIFQGDRALLYSTTYPELAPTFFRRARAGWQIDLVAGQAHIVSIAGGRNRWSFRDIEANPLALFREDLIVSNGLIRLAGLHKAPPNNQALHRIQTTVRNHILE